MYIDYFEFSTFSSVCYRWIEACIEDELPTTTELEEALRNGVILGRLGHFYAPEILPLRKIYDRDQAKYHVSSRVNIVTFCVYTSSLCICVVLYNVN